MTEIIAKNVLFINNDFLFVCICIATKVYIINFSAKCAKLAGRTLGRCMAPFLLSLQTDRQRSSALMVESQCAAADQEPK